jgi:hypothetical protein
MDNVIRVGYKPSELTGIGLEYLVVDGNVVAKFYNGNIMTAAGAVDPNQETVTAA